MCVANHLFQCPFSNAVPLPSVGHNVTGVEDLITLLPSSFRNSENDILTTRHHVTAFIDNELDVARLAVIHTWLWLAGLPIPPRPLHQQVSLNRHIFITERMDMHLVWTTGRMYIKPLPRWLLNAAFWDKYLCERGGSTKPDSPRQLHYRRALGFLYSYAALIAYESDFCIARDRCLIPKELTWAQWQAVVNELRLETIHTRIDKRFHHGELRLGRLTKIYYFMETPGKGYVRFWNQTSAFFNDNLAWVAGSTVYLAIVLTAMQVGLSNDALMKSDSFQSASYGFTVFAILGPLVVVFGILIAFCCLTIYSIVSTRKFCNEKEARIARGIS